MKGPGDEATWPAYSGHSGDPRADSGYDRDDVAERMRKRDEFLIEQAELDAVT